MDNNKIQIYKPLVWVEVSFGFNTEILYWEGNVEDFQQRESSNDYIIFSRHNNRRVPTSKIKDYAQLEKDDKRLMLEFKLSSLTEEQKNKVKSKMKHLKRNLGRDASELEIDSMIINILNPKIKIEKEKETFKELNKFQRFLTFMVIKKQKVARIITGSFFGFKDLNKKYGN